MLFKLVDKDFTISTFALSVFAFVAFFFEPWLVFIAYHTHVTVKADAPLIFYFMLNWTKKPCRRYICKQLSWITRSVRDHHSFKNFVYFCSMLWDPTDRTHMGKLACVSWMCLMVSLSHNLTSHTTSDQSAKNQFA